MSPTRQILITLAMLAYWAFAAQASARDDLAKRLEPVGQVCIQGKECPGLDVAATAGGASGAKSPDDVIGKHCITCHGTGLVGAPKVGDSVEWDKRAQEQGGLDGLLAKAISGINAMPPRGTCADCSDVELKGAIKKMSGL